MKSKIVSIFLCLVMVASISVTITQNLGPLSMNASGVGGLADSPWPMFRQNLNHTGVSPYDTSANNGQLKWTFSTVYVIFSSPAIGSDGTIYVGSYDDNLYAINPDGTKKWSFLTGDDIPSSPAIGSDGTIYVGSRDNKFYAVNSDGTEKWNFTTGSVVHSSPAIGSDGIIYVGSDDDKLYAFNSDGTEKWSFETGSHVHSSPAIGSDGMIYVGSVDGNLYAINPDGTEKWNFTTDYKIWSSPAIGSNGTIYVGSNDHKLYAFKPDGTEKWNFTTGAGVTSSPAIGTDGTIYVGSKDHNLYAINPDGTEKWRFTTGAFIYSSSPAISSDGTIYIGSQDYKLYAINPGGTEKWNFTTGSCVYSSPAIGSDGTIYIGSYDDKLYAIGPLNVPPIAEAGSDQTVNLGDIVQFNGSASYDPDGIIVNFEWDFDTSDGLWWQTGAPPDAFGPNPIHVYGKNGVFIATLRVTDNNGSMDTDTCVIVVQIPLPLPPNLYINVSLDRSDVILYWDPPSSPDIEYYLLYRSTSQIGFDFNTVWVNTSKDNESGEPGPIPLRTMWNDANAALPSDLSHEEEYYYLIRAVDALDRVSYTSRTVGKWTKTFPQGVSTFSLPLEPLETVNTTADYYLKDMNARYIKWMDPTIRTWNKHGDGGVNDTQMDVGKGYEVKFSSETNYTFTGMPGAMIRYKTGGFIGFNYNTDAKNLSASVDSLTGNVTLTWVQPLSMDGDDNYYIYRSTTRDGFNEGTATKIGSTSYGNEMWIDANVALSPGQFYYMIVPVNETGVEGASTYSLGVWTEEYLSGYDTLGVPLKQSFIETADWYCDNIPDSVGINYYIQREQRWCWHSTRMPEGAYDPILVMAEGYQISTSNLTKFTFIGV